MNARSARVVSTLLLYLAMGWLANTETNAQIGPPPGPITAVRPAIVTVPPGGPPIIIATPGAYRLGGSLVGISGAHGIEIQASDVTLDLDGHVVDGLGVGVSGIAVVGPQTNIQVHNGDVTNWREYGVDLSMASNSSVERLRVSLYALSGPLFSGIEVGNACRVTNCVVDDVAGAGLGDGITTGVAGTVRECTVSSAGSLGIAVRDGSQVTKCNVENAGINGIRHFGSIQGGMIANNTVTANVTGLEAIRVESNVYVKNNSISAANSPLMDGIEVLGDGCRIEGNHMRLSPFAAGGIQVNGFRNYIFKNTVIGSMNAYVIPNGNTHGTLVNMTLGGVVPLDPWANFFMN